jgi:hypothetical protein
LIEHCSKAEKREEARQVALKAERREVVRQEALEIAALADAAFAASSGDDCEELLEIVVQRQNIVSVGVPKM